jgi:hypothetical protein
LILRLFDNCFTQRRHAAPHRIISVLIAYFFSCWLLPVLLCYLDFSVVKLGKAVPKRNFAEQISAGRRTKEIRIEDIAGHQSNALIEPPIDNVYSTDGHNYGQNRSEGTHVQLRSPSYRNAIELYGDADRSDVDLDKERFDDNFDDDDDFIQQKTSNDNY